MEESRGYSGGEGVAAAETEAETMDVEDDAGEVSVGQRARVKTDTRVILNCGWKSRGKESCTSTRGNQYGVGGEQRSPFIGGYRNENVGNDPICAYSVKANA